MADLLLKLQKLNILRGQKDRYATPNRMRPVGKSYISNRNRAAEPAERPKDFHDNEDTQERKVGTLGKEDFLLKQIEEFRESAKQLQSLLDTKESETQELQTLLDEREEKTQELQTLLDERQEKADELGKLLEERQDLAEDVSSEVERHIDSLIAKVTAKMDEIESSMRRDVADGKRLNEENAKELLEMLEQITDQLTTVRDELADKVHTEQLTTVKNELADKVHSENVKCYRNISDLFKSVEEKVAGLEDLDSKLSMLKGFMIGTMLIAILDFIVMIVLMVFALGSLTI